MTFTKAQRKAVDEFFEANDAVTEGLKRLRKVIKSKALLSVVALDIDSLDAKEYDEHGCIPGEFKSYVEDKLEYGL